MKHKPSIERLRELLSYDIETGLLHWKMKPSIRIRVGDVAGSKYATGCRVSIDGANMHSHRVVWMIHYGIHPDGPIDHINGDPTDNRISNLRIVTPSGNSQNMRKLSCRNKSGFLGVSYNGKLKRPWVAQITVNNKSQRIGNYGTPEEAYQAYLSKKRQLHTTCTL